MKPLKLSFVEIKVLTLMREGWELGKVVSCSMGRRIWWLQKNGLGKGGDVFDVRDIRTCYNLYRKGLIKRVNPGITEFPSEEWRLTKLGEEIEIVQR